MLLTSLYWQIATPRYTSNVAYHKYGEAIANKINLRWVLSTLTPHQGLS
ncbi:MAG: hypothetical protein RMZ69_00405 [Nostoc sp. ChiQUE01a]|nr:hypothetical protein [Nostoc sp. ChiQUE01a]